MKKVSHKVAQLHRYQIATRKPIGHTVGPSEAMVALIRSTPPSSLAAAIRRGQVNVDLEATPKAMDPWTKYKSLPADYTRPGLGFLVSLAGGKKNFRLAPLPGSRDWLLELAARHGFQKVTLREKGPFSVRMICHSPKGPFYQTVEGRANMERLARDIRQNAPVVLSVEIMDDFGYKP